MIVHMCCLLSLFLFEIVTAQLTVIRPSASQWWVAQSINTLAWNGSTPTQFSVFLYNPNSALLTSKLALESIVNTYDYSLNVDPGNVNIGTGYQIQLTDTLNSNTVYASSESFEIHPKGSPYPTQAVTTTLAGNVATTASGGTVSTSSAVGASTTAKSSGGTRSRSIVNMMVLVGVLGVGLWFLNEIL